MDTIGQGIVTVLASLVTGGVSAYLAYRVSMREKSISADAKIRRELKELIRDERSAHSDCLAEVRSMRAELTDARVSAARWEARCETIERIVKGLHESIAHAIGPKTDP